MATKVVHFDVTYIFGTIVYLRQHFELYIERKLPLMNRKLS